MNAARVLAALAALLATAAAPPADPIGIGAIRVQLFYEYSGTLSANIAPPSTISLWNTGAGEGDAKEPASNALVTVPIVMKPADMAEFTRSPLTITVRNAAGKTIASRRYAAGMLLVPVTGKAFASLWLNDIQCAGRLRIEARYATQARAATLDFACGE